MSNPNRTKARNKSRVTNWVKMKICIKEFTKTIWKINPSFYIVYSISILVNVAAPFINIIFPKYIIDEMLVHGSMKKIAIYVGCIVILNYLVNIVQHTTNAFLDDYEDVFSKYIERMISSKIMHMDYQYTEDKKALEQLEKAKIGMSSYSGGMSGILNIIKNMIISVLQLFAISIIVLTKVPWLIVVFLISIILNYRFTKVLNQIEFKSYTQLSRVNRMFSYIYWELQELRFGMDIRLFHAEKMMEDKAVEYNAEMIGEWRKKSENSLPYQLLLSVNAWTRTVIEIILLAVKVLNGTISIGEFYELYNGGNILHGSINGIVSGFQNLMKRCAYAYEYIIFMQYPDAKYHGTKRIKEKMEHEIEFRNVFFHYPNSDALILKNINLVLKQGDHISVVGLNGAGKTTFIKLLCRLYDPTEGEILLDGINIVEYDYEDYVKLISVIFQDYQIYSFTVLENIKMSDSDAVICNQDQMNSLMRLTKKKYKRQLKSIENAIVKQPLFVLDSEQNRSELPQYDEVSNIIKQVGLHKIVNQLNYGLNTFVNRQYEKEGTDFSGGEKQKLAIARALYKNAPIVILDEPTAALDPIAEHEIYCKFDDLVKGRTAIYISHRLASCQFCDRIYVFHHGEIKEIGTHEELLSINNGVYARMYLAQAQYYDTN